jgi:hypothetical protein
MSEHDEQAAFVNHVLWAYAIRADFARPLFFSVPNGAWLGGKQYAMINKLKAEGLTPGIADILYLQPRGEYAYLAIEMKSKDRRNEKNGGLSNEQSAFLQAAIKAGALAEVCYGADEAIAAFDFYMGFE